MSEHQRPVTISAILGDCDSASRAWGAEIGQANRAAVQAAANSASEPSPLALNIVFHVDGRLAPNEFEGLRTGRFSRDRKTLVVQVAIAAAPVEHPQRFLWDRVTAAIDLAERFAVSRKIAPDLSHIREVIRAAAGLH